MASAWHHSRHTGFRHRAWAVDAVGLTMLRLVIAGSFSTGRRRDPTHDPAPGQIQVIRLPWGKVGGCSRSTSVDHRVV
jgi:hypothetical protein